MKKLNICLLGDSRTGKTSYVDFLIGNNFKIASDMTIGVDLHTVYFQENKEKNYMWRIYDTAGNNNFITITEQYLKDKDYYLLFIDITSEESINNIPFWINKIKNNCREDFKILILGNKLDCKNKPYQNLINQIITRLDIKYIEISVKNKYNLDQVEDLINTTNNNSKFIISNTRSANYEYAKLDDENSKNCLDCLKCVIL